MEPEDFPEQMSRTKHLKGDSVACDRSLRVLDRSAVQAGYSVQTLDNHGAGDAHVDKFPV